MEPPRIIFESPAASRRRHIALAGKIAAGTLAASLLAAGGVEVFGGFSSHGSQDDQLGLSHAAAAVSAPSYAKLASTPWWTDLRIADHSKRHASGKRAHAAKHHAKGKHSKRHAGAARSAHHRLLAAGTTGRGPTGTSHSSGRSASHPATSWSSHSSWHTHTSPNGKTTKVTTTTHNTTVGGKTTSVTHTHTSLAPTPPTPSASVHSSAPVGHAAPSSSAKHGKA